MTEKSPRVFLHQIFFQESQKRQLEPVLLPYDNSENPKPEWHEYHTFLTEHARGAWEEDAYYGYVSWKFGMKTGVSGQQFLDFINQNPGADVYFVNPFHEYSLTFRNVWSQADYFHPGLHKLAQDVFGEIGFDAKLSEMVNGEWDTAFCNYWVAKPSFWRKYLPYITATLELATDANRASLATRLNAPVPRHASATYLTFVLERIFTCLIGRGTVDARAYSFSEEWLRERYGVLYDHVAPLRDLKKREASGVLSASESVALEAYRRLFLQYKELEFAYQVIDTPLAQKARKLLSKMPRWAGGLRA